MKEAEEYGSSFTRGTRVYIDNSELGKVALFFLSGCASVDEEGKIFGRTIEQQTDRMHQNASSLFSNALMTFEDIVHSAFYSQPILFNSANQLVAEQHPEMDYSGIWYQGAICRPKWKIETDSLAVDGNLDNPLLKRVIELYSQYHRQTMTGEPAELRSDKLQAGDLTFLFVYNFAETSKISKDEIPLKEYKRLIRSTYREITQTLAQENASWLDVVNTRISMPSMLNIPPGIRSEDYPNLVSQPDYYTIGFNPVRTNNVFIPAGVGQTPENPLPSSTGVGVHSYRSELGVWVPVRDSLVFSISALAIFQNPR